ncbi:hypothetical protein RPB_4501 [Rhodopseudomonas palustris HaA2]|uniref:Uncharacterized protein n=1 Tax=Rhodopseudomonas palustris (strain HaA2) TaxID=316058 RepID=Q2IRH6_RHOP2|nr:hypothetical protein [Rhodopseudomonas palustris]ABD09184.1 hypothetical protein RPB_4501 [Rhodopseudomonas palustris HaA2]
MELGDLRIVADENRIVFLDDFRIGLRLQNRLQQIEGPINLSQDSPPAAIERPLAPRGMMRGEWGLAFSVERLSVSERLIGFLNTRSKYARLGLETMGSSWLIAPGFGYNDPTSVVFEVIAHNDLTGFSSHISYAYTMFFELDHPVRLDGRSYGGRFPH